MVRTVTTDPITVAVDAIANHQYGHDRYEVAPAGTHGLWITRPFDADQPVLVIDPAFDRVTEHDTNDGAVERHLGRTARRSSLTHAVL